MSSDCEIKINALQKYVPFLGELIETLKEDSTKAAKLRQMQLLHKLLTEPDAGVTIDMLLNCEKVLDKAFGNSQKEETISSCENETLESSVKEHSQECLDEIFNKICKDDAVEPPSEKESKEHPDETFEQNNDNKTEKETNSNKTGEKISEKSEDQKKEIEKEVSSEEPTDKEGDPTQNSHESQDELPKVDQSEKEDSAEVENELISTDEIIQEGQKHEQDLFEDKEENEKCETEQILEETENKKEEISPKVENKVDPTEENIQEGQKHEQKQDVVEENKEDDEICREKKEQNQICTPDEVMEEEENKLEEKVEAILPVDKTTEEVVEKVENKENPTEETNDEVQKVQTSPTDSEEPQNCDENKIKTQKDEDIEMQLKEEPERIVEVPEKLIETTNSRKEDNNDLALDSVKEVKVVESIVNKSKISEKQTSLEEQNNKLTKATSSPESMLKKELAARPKPIESNSTIKAIELKPKDPSEKPAVVYLLKKGAPKPVETIELLDSDSEDDDVILVSEVGLKKKTPAAKVTPKIAAKRTMPTNKTPQILAKVPSVIRQSTQGNKLMFAITSVQSIGQQQQKKQPTQQAQTQRNKNLTISPAKVRTQGIYSPGTITFHKVKQSPPIGVPQRTNIMVKQNSPLVTNKFVKRLNSQIVISSVGSTAGTSNAKTTFGTLSRSSIQNQIKELDDGQANGSANRSTQENESPWNPDKDCQRSKDWLENFMSNVLSPTQNVTPFGVDLLHRSLDIPVFARIKGIMEDNKKVFVSTLDKGVKVLHKNSDEIMALLFKDGSLTDAGVKLATFAKQSMNRVFTTDRRTGHITSKSRKRPKELDDDEYSPSVAVEFAQETVANRRRSLRRESKVNRKQYFAYEDDDDAEFLEMVEEQARIEANNRANKLNKIHKKPGPRRSNGSSTSSEPPSVKKMRLEEGTSVETPFETDLLKPTWVEDAVDEAYQDQYNEEPDEHEDDQEDQDGGFGDSLQKEEENNKVKKSEPQPEGKINTWKMSRLGRYHSKWKNFKNINRAHHCRSTFIDSCILCNIKHNFVVAHYVNHHRETEVLIARLTQRDVDQLVRNVNYGYLTASKSTAHQYSATCVFCKREMTFALRYWWEHYSMHTGEYGYECTKCFLRRPRRQHAQKHANNECHLGTADVRIIYDFDKTMNQIEAYICKLCNYIQIHKENVVKHLQQQHEIQFDPHTNIIRVVLLQISRPYNEDANGQDSLNNSNSFDYYDSSNGCMNIGTDNSYFGYDPNDEPDVTYMQYSGGMMGHDDLSFMICDMLATDDPTQQLPPATKFSFDKSSTLKKDGGGAQ